MKKYLIDYFKLDFVRYPKIIIGDGTPLNPQDTRPYLYDTFEDAKKKLNSHRYVNNDLKCIFEIETDQNGITRGILVYIEGKRVNFKA